MVNTHFHREKLWSTNPLWLFCIWFSTFTHL